jgi:hypothetical protein
LSNIRRLLRKFVRRSQHKDRRTITGLGRPLAGNVRDGWDDESAGFAEARFGNANQVTAVKGNRN